MVLLEAAFVFGLLGLFTYVVIRLLTPPARNRPAAGAGHWRVVHYDADGATRVAVEKAGAGGQVLDEHLVATIAVGDPAYDARFLAAMAAARERQALFEAEEG